MALLNGIKRVVCGISGGVDSAVAASILKQKGFEVVGAFMRNWDDQDEDGTCLINQENDYQDAKAICDHLRIPFVEVSFVKEYWNEVFTQLIEDYEKGFTPNPDILCNRFIKFGSFYRYSMKELGGDAIATGHYAQNSLGNFLKHYSPGKMAHLRRAIDLRKDQTLFLSDICQEPLRKTMFPLGGLCKLSVRQLAKDLGMDKVSKKRDSVGICFIGDRTFSHFISKYIEDRPGYFVDVDTGRILGSIMEFTNGPLGKGVGLGAQNALIMFATEMQTLRQF
ncbi:Mitochondrial tRNA-specific 2-thiouridylase 1 [Orchesella cincta]|uniref:tRNA-5-taurinomethyluridine 2-sulfurtransferase n=1 Tax=Orchesella cincta TaxID=48709 RepID=A0A1D2N6R5_ORCCI|nr:Mitochondrial tRNA-specific 2-thiouridylase 1 [Orchesella cincta]